MSGRCRDPCGSDNYRDLVIPINVKLNFTNHIADVVLSVSRLINVIFRCFIVRRPEFYIRLYQSLILPKLLYCCQVWRPYLKKDINALEALASRFARRVSLRCNVSKNSVVLPNIVSLYDRADFNMYITLKKLPSFDEMFEVNVNNLRSGNTVKTRRCAKTEKVNNQFVWRVVRQLR